MICVFISLQEAAKFSEVQKLGVTDVDQIALKMAALPKFNKSRSRVVIITQGADAVVAVVGNFLDNFLIL